MVEYVSYFNSCIAECCYAADKKHAQKKFHFQVPNFHINNRINRNDLPIKVPIKLLYGML
jgi:hypothetical protein